MIEYKMVEAEKESKIQCDVCKKTYDYYGDINDSFETDEFLKIDFTGGYGSVFGDGTRVRAEICQHCLRKLLGKYLRLELLDLEL